MNSEELVLAGSRVGKTFGVAKPWDQVTYKDGFAVEYDNPLVSSFWLRLARLATLSGTLGSVAPLAHASAKALFVYPPKGLRKAWKRSLRGY